MLPPDVAAKVVLELLIHQVDCPSPRQHLALQPTLSNNRRLILKQFNVPRCFEFWYQLVPTQPPRLQACSNASSHEIWRLVMARAGKQGLCLGGQVVRKIVCRGRGANIPCTGTGGRLRNSQAATTFRGRRIGLATRDGGNGGRWKGRRYLVC